MSGERERPWGCMGYCDNQLADTKRILNAELREVIAELGEAKERAERAEARVRELEGEIGRLKAQHSREIAKAMKIRAHELADQRAALTSEPTTTKET